MYAITGISGQVGGAVARSLLAQGLPVRAVLRDAGKAPAWRARGCEVALAAMDDAVALARAFAGAEAVFVLLPPDFDPAPGFPATRAVIAALAAALRQAGPRRVVCLSTVGAQASQENLLSQLQEMEHVLGQLPMPIAFLRAAWFMENAAWDLAGAREHGLVPSLLQPTSRAIPMVATADVGALAAQLLRQPWQGRKVVELEGPARVSPDELAAVLGRLLARRVVAQAVPREDWEARLRAQGSRHPLPRMRMLDGFNQGWITFEHATIKGETALEQVLRGLLEGAP